MKVRDLMLVAVLGSFAHTPSFAAPVAYGPEAIIQDAGGAPPADGDADKAKKKKKKKKADDDKGGDAGSK